MIVCISNEGYPASLIVGKEYFFLGYERGMVRVSDESGDDYLFPENLFDMRGASDL